MCLDAIITNGLVLLFDQNPFHQYCVDIEVLSEKPFPIEKTEYCDGDVFHWCPDSSQGGIDINYSWSHFNCAGVQPTPDSNGCITFDVCTDMPSYASADLSYLSECGTGKILTQLVNYSFGHEDCEGNGLDTMQIVGGGETETRSITDDLFKVEVYPNPSTRMVNVKSTSQSTYLTVYDSVGKLLDERILSNKESTIDISQYPIGIYNLHFSYGEKYIVKRIIINN